MKYPEFKVGDIITPNYDPKFRRFYSLVAGKPYTILELKENTGQLKDIWPYYYVLDVEGHNYFFTSGFKLYEEPEEDNSMDELHRLFEEKVKSLQ